MEEKIEVEEYVKTKDGIIAQIKSIDYEAGIYRFDRIIYNNDFGMKEDVLYNNEMFKKVIVKHSKQLIDLIEKDDYVNGYKIVEIYAYKDWIDIGSEVLFERDIKTILTKEQMEANCYKVGGEDESNI